MRPWIVAIVLGVLYQQLQSAMPNLAGDWWEALQQRLVPAVLPIEAFIVSWDLAVNFFGALIFVLALWLASRPLSARVLLVSLLPLAAFEFWRYLSWWGAFGPAEQDFWRNFLNAVTALVFPWVIWWVLRLLRRRSSTDTSA